MKWVVDASVAVKWLVPEVHSDEAIQLIGQPLIAPDLIHAEVAHVLWRKLVRQEIDGAVPAAAGRWLLEAGLEIHGCRELLSDAIKLSQGLRYPACDCFYLALAHYEDLPLITADRRLHTRCQQADAQALGLRVHLLGEPLTGAELH